jgi:hypothetical protein
MEVIQCGVAYRDDKIDTAEPLAMGRGIHTKRSRNESSVCVLEGVTFPPGLSSKKERAVFVLLSAHILFAAWKR